MEQSFSTMSEFETMIQEIIKSERSTTNNFDLIGLSMDIHSNILYLFLY
jgi:hypothetical protein